MDLKLQPMKLVLSLTVLWRVTMAQLNYIITFPSITGLSLSLVSHRDPNAVMSHHNIIQVRLSDDNQNIFGNNIYFTGNLKSSDSPISVLDSSKRLGYGKFSLIAQNYTPSIEVNPAEDILYLFLRREDLSLFVQLYDEFFDKARFIAMNAELGVRFIYDILPSYKFGALEKLFFITESACISTTRNKCQGVLRLDPIKREKSFDRELRDLEIPISVWLAREFLLECPCFHFPNIRPCQNSTDNDFLVQSGSS